MKELAEKINPNWHSVFIANILVLGLLLLFYEKLPVQIAQNLIQGVVIYTLGNALIGNLQGIIYRSKGMSNNFKEPLWIYMSLYVVWFIAFLWYILVYAA